MREPERASLATSAQTLVQALPRLGRRQTTIILTWVSLILFATWLYEGGSITQIIPQPHNVAAAKGDILNGHQSLPVSDPSKSPIPPKIWQILLPKGHSRDQPIDPEQLKDTASWLAMNVDYK